MISLSTILNTYWSELNMCYVVSCSIVNESSGTSVEQEFIMRNFNNINLEPTNDECLRVINQYIDNINNLDENQNSGGDNV